MGVFFCFFEKASSTQDRCKIVALAIKHLTLANEHRRKELKELYAKQTNRYLKACNLTTNSHREHLDALEGSIFFVVFVFFFYVCIDIGACCVLACVYSQIRNSKKIKKIKTKMYKKRKKKNKQTNTKNPKYFLKICLKFTILLANSLILLNYHRHLK